jgi:hypothetical protein
MTATMPCIATAVTFAMAISMAQYGVVSSFSVPLPPRAFSRTIEQKGSVVSLRMATGMGMGSATATKKKGKVKGTKTGKSAAAFGGKASTSKTASFDVAASLSRLEKQYDALLSEADKSIKSDDEFHKDGDAIVSEYVLAARCRPGNSAPSAVSDWVPIAQLAISRQWQHNNDDALPLVVRSAVSCLRREVGHAAMLGSSSFKDVSRDSLEYSAEPLSSFEKFVYGEVLDNRPSGASDSEEETKVSKGRAREILKLDEEQFEDRGAIRRAYRAKTFELHPDRFVGVDRTEVEIKTASDEFALVKLAYETLNSGVRNNAATNGDSSSSVSRQSWYESLGGRSRTDFVGPIEMISMDTAKANAMEGNFKCAITMMNRSYVKTFVAINQAAGMN